MMRHVARHAVGARDRWLPKSLSTIMSAAGVPGFLSGWARAPLEELGWRAPRLLLQLRLPPPAGSLVPCFPGESIKHCLPPPLPWGSLSVYILSPMFHKCIHDDPLPKEEKQPIVLLVTVELERKREPVCPGWSSAGDRCSSGICVITPWSFKENLSLMHVHTHNTHTQPDFQTPRVRSAGLTIRKRVMNTD